jgi:hypothetical protein
MKLLGTISMDLDITDQLRTRLSHYSQETSIMKIYENIYFIENTTTALSIYVFFGNVCS